MNGIGQLDAPADVTVRNLVTFDLEDNKLEEISESLIICCPRLQNLMLMNNNLRNVPLLFGTWQSLRSLTLAGNPLKSIPQSTVSKGTDSIKKLLKERLPK
jgi:Leucine-rich repeat (LRR) protein